MCMKFRTFWKKRRVSEPNYYRNYCIRKRCLLKPLKALASADHWVINGLTGSKHCWSQQGITIFNFFHESEINWVEKKSALVTSEIIRLFVNTLTPDEKYSHRYMQTFWQQVQTPLSQKERDFFKIFYWISEICMKFRTFRKKRRVS